MRIPRLCFCRVRCAHAQFVFVPSGSRGGRPRNAPAPATPRSVPLSQTGSASCQAPGFAPLSTAPPQSAPVLAGAQLRGVSFSRPCSRGCRRGRHPCRGRPRRGPPVAVCPRRPRPRAGGPGAAGLVCSPAKIAASPALCYAVWVAYSPYANGPPLGPPGFARGSQPKPTTSAR